MHFLSPRWRRRHEHPFFSAGGNPARHLRPDKADAERSEIALHLYDFVYHAIYPLRIMA